MSSNSAIWAIAAVATFGVIVRPWNLPEFVWTIAGAAMLVLFQLLPWKEAVAAVGEGTDVYLFLIGMMLLSEVARKEGLFDWLAIRAVRLARGSAKRLFLIIYVVGTVVTAFLSNDATAVVMTPAVYATTRAAQVEPLPYLFICVFVANAASFILPIANPGRVRRADAGALGLAALFCRPIICCDSRDIFRIAADATAGARCEGRHYRERTSNVVRWQGFGDRNSADSRNATVGICVRLVTRLTDVLRRRIVDCHRVDHRATIAAPDP
jgi:hypothetical protein